MLKRLIPNKLKSPRYVACFLIAFCVLVYAGTSIPERLAFSKTNSVGYRWFFIQSKNTQHIKKGDYVLFPLYTKLVPNCWPCTVVKKIACTEGSYLKVEQRDFFCNSEYLGTAKTNSKKGVSVETFKYDGVISTDNVFVMGACGDSYDSRYFGFVDKKDIKAVVVPII